MTRSSGIATNPTETGASDTAAFAKRNLSVADLEPGDVLTFSPDPGDFISKMITLLTKENVSHAALAFRNPSTMLEQTPPRISVASLEIMNPPDRFQGRSIFVNRLKVRPTPDMELVLAAGDKYLGRGDKYGEANLYLVGVLLLVRPVVGLVLTRRNQILLTRLFARLTSKILDQINRGETEMFCSQLVYQVYEDAKQQAGENFDLGLSNPIIPFLKGTSTLLQPAILWDKIYLKVNQDGIMPEPGPEALLPEMFQTEQAQDDPSVIVQQLYLALMNEQETGVPTTCLDSSASNEDKELEVASDLALVVANFAAVLNFALVGDGEKVPKQTKASALRALTNFKEAQFVTPADLYNRCRNLERVGMIHFDAIPKEQHMSELI